MHLQERKQHGKNAVVACGDFSRTVKANGEHLSQTDTERIETDKSADYIMRTELLQKSGSESNLDSPTCLDERSRRGSSRHKEERVNGRAKK